MGTCRLTDRLYTLHIIRYLSIIRHLTKPTSILTDNPKTRQIIFQTCEKFSHRYLLDLTKFKSRLFWVIEGFGIEICGSRHHPVEDQTTASGNPTVEAEDELIKIRLGIFLVNPALVGSVIPTFQQ